jgi:uncharacterized membrane protein YgcG
MKKIFTFILISLFTISLFSSCETTYAATTVYDDMYEVGPYDYYYTDIYTITTYGTPYYLDGVLQYYIYKNLYYYPFYYNNVLYYRTFYRPLPVHHHYNFGKPHRGDLRFGHGNRHNPGRRGHIENPGHRPNQNGHINHHRAPAPNHQPNNGTRRFGSGSEVTPQHHATPNHSIIPAQPQHRVTPQRPSTQPRMSAPQRSITPAPAPRGNFGGSSIGGSRSSSPGSFSGGSRSSGGSRGGFGGRR